MRKEGIAIVMAWVMLAGCDRLDAKATPEVATNTADTATSEEAATVEATADEDTFLQTFDGVWATLDNAGNDDGEEVFRFQFARAGSLFVRDRDYFEVRLVDADPGNRVATFETSGKHAPKELLTVSQIVAPADRIRADAPFHLRVTFGDGQFSDLSFVRRLAPQDLAAIADARQFLQSGQGLAPAPERVAASACVNPTEFAERMVCKDPALKQAQAAFEAAFERAMAEYGEDAAGSRISAHQQIAACASTECLRDTWSSWTTYVGENFPERPAHAE